MKNVLGTVMRQCRKYVIFNGLWNITVSWDRKLPSNINSFFDCVFNFFDKVLVESAESL